MVQEMLLSLGKRQDTRKGRRLLDRRHQQGEPVMMESIREFFQTNLAEPGGDEKDVEPSELRLAACALLLELAYADDDFTEEERDHLKAAVRRQFGLDEEQAARLIDLAEEQRARAVDLWSFTNLIAENYSLGQKMVLAEAMWGLVFSDGKLASREDYLMRKISGLLRLEPGYLAEARKRVEEHQSEADSPPPHAPD
jgi:uncharacterized tellurite resistance protein B-like protein